MDGPPDTDEADDDTGQDDAVAAPTRLLTIPEELAGQRLDRALAELAVRAGLDLSRSRIAALIAGGAVVPAGSVSDRVRAGESYRITLPPPLPARPEPEAIPLAVVFEDRHLIVIDKPAGMVVHPAPGAERGTLVNALLHHCGDTLSGIGGERRPGIVHRIDKDTSGLIVAAKSETAHRGLAAAFAAHDIDRVYTAIVWGAPERNAARLAGVEGVSFGQDGALRVEAPLGRHPVDRKRMTVRPDGRRAVTHLAVEERFGEAGRPVAARLACRLETGRTHQIRVHAAHVGHPLVGDPVYGRPRKLGGHWSDEARTHVELFQRQALHAARLGFVHPVTGAAHSFCAELPTDMHELLTTLRRNP